MTKIENYLINKGIRVQYKGFDCLVEAIKLVQKDRTYKNSITKRLYPDVAKTLNETASKVERAIRHAISKSKVLYMTNGEFISRAALELKAS